MKTSNRAISTIRARLGRGSAVYGAAVALRYRHPAACALLAAMLAVSLAALVLAAFAPFSPAHADVNEIISQIENMMPWNWPKNLLDAGLSNATVSTSSLQTGFTALLGENSGAYAVIKTVNDDVMKPISISILAIVFLVEVAKIANDFESHGTLPPFKNIVFMWVCCAVCLVLMNKTMQFCEAIFDMFNALISNVDTSVTVSFATSSMIETIEATNIVGGWFAELLIGLIVWILAFIVQVVTFFSVIGRALQVYVYAAVSPLAIAFFGSEKTQPWAIGFVKSFIALCLAGLIMVLVIRLMPYAISGLAEATDSSLYLMVIALMLVYVKAMASAGSWAKEIIGG
jgi:hypothetical protein